MLNTAKDVDFQQILKNPILDIAAHFWEDERYDAFKVCYKSMRVLDDLVDDNRVLSKTERQQILSKLYDMQSKVQLQLAETRSKFNIPLWPWERLFKAMVYDVSHSGFKTFQSFLDYCEGAAVAPASIFMHLCGTIKKNGKYHIPDFDIKESARSLAIFCYIVHIIRDFQKDQNNNLNYFADDLIEENGVTKSTLKDIAAGGKIPTGFRNLMKKYHSLAGYYKNKARTSLDQLDLEPRYALSLEIIYNLYVQIFEKIDISQGNFTTMELNPSHEEVKKRIDATISSFES